MEVQGGLTQILGDILGYLILAHLQPLAQLYHHLVALVPAQQGQGAHQSVACGVPHHHPLRHLDQVGEVGGDVQDVGVQPVLHLVPQQLHPGHLDDPGGGRLQVVQEHLAGDVHVIEGLL